MKLKLETRDDGRHAVTFGGVLVEGVRSARVDASADIIATLHLEVIDFDVEMEQSGAKVPLEPAPAGHAATDSA